MAGSLKNVTNWPELAKQGRYEVAVVAEKLGVSPRCLEKFFKRYMPNNPHNLFALWRAEEVGNLKAAGMVGKEIIDKVNLANPASLTRALILATGRGLRQARRKA